ncbi:hypothetical protein EC973_008894 [Apophysomyces ossiformis]|uniref:Vacuolar membrane protein n=1 Tax=Apophysomyces ossiformis TaxID=679940 RepID=A0A8H7BZ18_9FUNG|nr:hypothetical protein EC973_008894 [Apophysomyces ossiformis]
MVLKMGAYQELNDFDRTFDVSKQLLGGIVIHSLNVLAASVFGGSEGEQRNPCVWYFLNIFVDTTLGVVILWGVLKGLKKLTRIESGVYGEPPLQAQIRRWSTQLAIYIIGLIIMKVVVVAIFHLCPWLEGFGRWVLQWTMGNYKLQIVFVMLIFPLVMNVIQFWIVDTIVKHKATESIYLASDEEVLLTADDNDEEELVTADHIEGEEEAYFLTRPKADRAITTSPSNDVLHGQRTSDDSR